MEELEKWLKGGKIVCFPRKAAAKIRLLEYIIERSFEKNIVYTERDINKGLEYYHQDVAYLRRLMIDYKLIDRDRYGNKYWVKQ